MINARLTRDLENKGFILNLPAYNNNERIIAILKSRNERLYLAIPLLLLDEFDYNIIINKSKMRREFDKAIAIAAKIYRKEGINRQLPARQISIKDSEFNYYLDAFKDSLENKETEYDKETSELASKRGKLGLSKSLESLFSPAKIEIMKKIFQYEKLTNTELKYYYKAIRPLIHAILDSDLRDYVKIIDDIKKRH